MTKRTITIVLIAIVCVGLIAWDLIALSTPGATISEIIQTAAFHQPLIPFAAGFLCGHFFFPIQWGKDQEPWNKS